MRASWGLVLLTCLLVGEFNVAHFLHLTTSSHQVQNGDLMTSAPADDFPNLFSSLAAKDDLKWSQQQQPHHLLLVRTRRATRSHRHHPYNGGRRQRYHRRVDTGRVERRHFAPDDVDLRTPEGRRDFLRDTRDREGENRFGGPENSQITSFNTDQDLQNRLRRGRTELEQDADIEAARGIIDGQQSWTLVDSQTGDRASINLGPMDRDQGDLLFERRRSMDEDGFTSWRALAPRRSSTRGNVHVETFYHGANGDRAPNYFNTHLNTDDIDPGDLTVVSSPIDVSPARPPRRHH